MFSCSTIVVNIQPKNGNRVDEDYWRNFNGDIQLPATDWLATTRNYILKIDRGKLMHSSDLGKHWKSMNNIFDCITFVHWFSDGTCLICSPSQAYYTYSFDSLQESNIYDYDGTLLTNGTGCYSFFHEFNYNSPINIINDKEVAIWTDYDNSDDYISRIWSTDDKGKTIKCILKNKESLINGEQLNITHFHDCIWDKYSDCLWVTTGDYGDGNMLIKGEQIRDDWEWRIISRGDSSKYGQVSVDNEYLYLVTDNTWGDSPTGLIRVKKDSVEFPSAYHYLYKNYDNTAFIQFLDDGRGHRILFPDGAQSNLNTLYYASQCYDFRKMPFICSDGANRILGQIYGPNNNGDIIAITYYGYGTRFSLDMKRYMLSTGLKYVGLM